MCSGSPAPPALRAVPGPEILAPSEARSVPPPPQAIAAGAKRPAAPFALTDPSGRTTGSTLHRGYAAARPSATQHCGTRQGLGAPYAPAAARGRAPTAPLHTAGQSQRLPLDSVDMNVPAQKAAAAKPVRGESSAELPQHAADDSIKALLATCQFWASQLEELPPSQPQPVQQGAATRAEPTKRRATAAVAAASATARRGPATRAHTCQKNANR